MYGIFIMDGDNMKVVKIKKLANNKYKIYLDNNDVIDTYDEVILKNNILYKKEIDDELYKKLTKDNTYYALYNKCINLISKRIRSEKEVRDYLAKYESKDIDKIIDNLKQVHLINDDIFMKAYISDKINLTNNGPLRIENDLISHNIDVNKIEEELAKIDIEIIKNKINKYISKKAKSNKHSSYFFKEKILNELINEGYPKDLILLSLDKLNIKSNIENEYKKIYNKLSKKYDSNELDYQIKNKLYQKGYKKEEIDKIKNQEF